MCQPCQIKLTSENFIIIKYILHKTLFAVDPDRGATVCKGMGSDSSSDAHHFCILKLSNFDVANASDVIACHARYTGYTRPHSMSWNSLIYMSFMRRNLLLYIKVGYKQKNR